MTRFARLRELMRLARGLEAEARKLPPDGDARVARLIEAEEHRLEATFLAGRIDRDEHAAGLVECQDARAHPTD